MNLIHFVDHGSTGHGLCGAGRVTDSYTSSPGWVSCLVCRAKLVDRKKESAMKPMHFMTFSSHKQICNGDRARYGTTDPTQVTCDACKQTTEWMTEAILRGIEMPKDALQEARELRELANTMLARAGDIERKAKREMPDEPPRAAGNSFKVNVRFAPGGKLYTFLLLRTEFGGQWFSTGNRPEHSVFSNWEALIEWLNGPKVHMHGAVIRLADPTSLITYRGADRFAAGEKTA